MQERYSTKHAVVYFFYDLSLILEPFSSAARKEPLPALPPTSGISAASNKSLPQSMGVKVMPNISSQINTITSEPIAGKVRNAPPVPNR